MALKVNGYQLQLRDVASVLTLLTTIAAFGGGYMLLAYRVSKAEEHDIEAKSKLEAIPIIQNDLLYIKKELNQSEERQQQMQKLLEQVHDELIRHDEQEKVNKANGRANQP